MKILAALVGLVIGWVAGVWLYFGGLWLAGENPVGGIHIAAFMLGLIGATIGAAVAYRFAGTRHASGGPKK